MNAPRDELLFLSELTAILEREDIPYALIGAFALLAHNSGRTTFDVDLLTTESRVLTLEWADLVSDQVRVQVNRGDHDDPLAGVVRLQPLNDLSYDIVVGRWKWQRDAIARAQKLTLSGVPLPVLNPVDLCVTKIEAGSAKDLRDATLLLERNPSLRGQLEGADGLPNQLRERVAAFLQSL